MKLLVATILLQFSLGAYSVERPDLALNIEHHFVCKNGKSFSGKKYKSICRNISRNPDPMLYLVMDVDDSILFHDQLINEANSDTVLNDGGLGTVYNWCSKELIDPTTGYPTATGVNCVIHATTKKRPHHKGQLFVNYIKQDSNLIGLNISTLSSGIEYYLELVEVTSTSKSKRILFKNPL